MTVAGHLLFLATQRIETVVTGMGIHALCHGLRCSGFDILASNFLVTASLKLGDKVKMTVSSDSGKITERMSFQTATVIEFKKLVANKLQAERIQELFTELVVNKCKDQIQRSMLRANKNSKAKQLPLV